MQQLGDRKWGAPHCMKLWVLELHQEFPRKIWYVFQPVANRWQMENCVFGGLEPWNGL